MAMSRMSMSAQSSHTTLNNRVKQAFSLSQDDLDANRAGQMTAPQQTHVESRRTDKFMTLGIGGIMAIVFGCASLGGPNATSRGLGIAVLCGVSLLVPLGLIMLANMKEDAQARQVISLQGPVRLRKTWTTKKTTYEVILQSKTFKVAKEHYEGFVDGEAYILYYTPSSQILVGAEHISGPVAPSSNPLTSPAPHI
jgi:hypothetical protein